VNVPGAGVVELLAAGRGGNAEAVGRLHSILYGELRRAAHVRLTAELDGAAFGSGALVHEACRNLAHIERLSPSDRGWFVVMAARTMRRILVDEARRVRAERYARDNGAPDLEDVMRTAERQADGLVALGDALALLDALNPRLADVVDCRFFAGLTEHETAEALAVTAEDISAEWLEARTLHRQAFARMRRG
jgi:RNA polymerase sigma factor (TIGR02999 family)